VKEGSKEIVNRTMGGEREKSRRVPLLDAGQNSYGKRERRLFPFRKTKEERGVVLENRRQSKAAESQHNWEKMARRKCGDTLGNKEKNFGEKKKSLGNQLVQNSVELTMKKMGGGVPLL